MYIANEKNWMGSHNWESGFPGAQDVDLKAHPEFRGEVPHPKGEGFMPVNTLDWCNPLAVEYCLGVYRWVCEHVYDVDALMFSEESFGWMRNHPQSGVGDWYSVPAFSEHALASYRKFVGDPSAKFPSPKEFPNTERTFNSPTKADWDRWTSWLRFMHAQFIHRRAEVSFEANRGNERFLGQAVYGDVSSIGGTQWAYYTEDPALISRSPYVMFYVLERLNRGSWLFWAAQPERVRVWIKAIRDNGAKYIYWAQPTRYGEGYPPADARKPGFWNAQADGLRRRGGQIAAKRLPDGSGFGIEVAIPFGALRQGYRPRADEPLPTYIQLDELTRNLYARWLDKLCRIEVPATWGKLTFGAAPVRQATQPGH